MEFVCLQSEIKQSLSLAESIVPTRSTISILTHVLIETNGNTINLGATDLEIGFSSNISAEIISPGSITVQARKLSDIVKSFINTPLRFTLNHNVLEVKADNEKIKTDFNLQGLSKDDFPKIPVFIEHNVFRLNEVLFRSIIRKTIPAASLDESRHTLNGILFEKHDEELSFIATDGKRLAVLRHTINNKNEEIEDFEIVVPSSALNELAKILDGKKTDKESECLISITEKKAFFKIDNIEVFSNIYEDGFPAYNEVVPDKKIQNIAVMDRMELLDAIKKVAIMIDSKISLLILEFKENILTISGNNIEFGEAKDEIMLESKISNIRTAFNYNYIIDAIKEIEQKDIELYMTEHTKPILIQGKNEDNYFSVIMPMKLPGE